MTHFLTFLVVKGVPFGLIIGLPAIKIMRASLHTDKDIVTLKAGTKVVKVSLWTGKERGGQALSRKLAPEKEEHTECLSEDEGYVKENSDEDV